MTHAVVLALIALQQPAESKPPQLIPQPIARVEVRPSGAELRPGDSLQLVAIAYDSAGAPLDSVIVKWFATGGMFEGAVDSTGVVKAGATGTLKISAVATLAGRTVRPTVGYARFTVLPAPAVRLDVSPRPTRLVTGVSVTVGASAYAANGDRRYDPPTWRSTRSSVVRVDAHGRLTAVAPGTASITAAAGGVTAGWTVTVVPNAIARVALAPADTALRTGDVVRFRYAASDANGRRVGEALPEWSVASLTAGSASIDGDGAFVADEPGTYRVVATLGPRRAEAVVQVAPRKVVRQAKIVGRLPLKDFRTAELWLHPGGRHAYLSTVGDRMYALDLTDPSKPVVTDSVMVDARHINDVMTTEDGKYGVLTREGASTRKNGIVILSFQDPAHPKQIAEFTETVSGGVHSAFVYRGHVYLTDDATGSMRVIDIRDPEHPKQVARWEVVRSPAGRMLHDIAVENGLAYLSYWNDGLVVLDVGNGLKGGSPANPRLVTQVKYDLNEIYKNVELAGGPGFIRGTHTAWRAGRYVFVADEVFPAQQPRSGIGVLQLGRAYGRVHAVDVSDIEHPKLVAWYEAEDGGAHNVWVAGDSLYLGDYQGGLRVIDVSGELMGDLMAQGRQIAHVHTGDSDGYVVNVANAWGAIYRDGLIYVNDMNSGLWIVKLEPIQTVVP